MSSLHGGALQHNSSSCQDARKQDEPHSWSSVSKWVETLLILKPLHTRAPFKLILTPRYQDPFQINLTPRYQDPFQIYLVPVIVYIRVQFVLDCKDLLKRLLKSNPDERIKMSQIMDHPWMNEGHTLPFGPAPFPNRLQLLDINNDIIQHMVHHLKVQSVKSWTANQFCLFFSWKTLRIIWNKK